MVIGYVPAPVVAGENLLGNPGLEYWSRGPGPFATTFLATADLWTTDINAGSTMSVVRDSANADASSGYCAACTSTGVGPNYLVQDFGNNPQLRGRRFTFTARIKTATANAVRLVLYDDVGSFNYSAYHTGSGAYQTLTVTRTATEFVKCMVVMTATCVAYVDNTTLVVGNQPLPYAPLYPTEDQARLRPDDEQYVLAPQVNGLTNPGMETWQRGNGPFTVTASYGPDRWQLSQGTGSTFSVSRDTVNVDTGSLYCMAVAHTLSPGNPSRILQIMEQYGQLRNQWVALSFRVKVSTPNAVRAILWDSVNGFRYGGYHSGSGAYETLTVVGGVSPTATMVQCSLGFDATCTAYVDNATLVVGRVAAPYQPLHPADDLGRCLRYYESLPAAVAGAPYASLILVTTARGWGPIRWAQKALTPTVTLSAAANFRGIYAGGAIVAASTVAVTSASLWGGLFDLIVGSAVFTVGQAGYVDAANNSAAVNIEANP